jgi:hypothetical protein
MAERLFSMAEQSTRLGIESACPRTRTGPHDLADAISAKIVRWNAAKLGVSYVFPTGDGQVHPIGTQDYAALTRLARAGKLTFVDDEAGERYEAMKRMGLFSP